jgi:oligoendopeptidase F
MNSPDRTLRKNSWETLFETIGKHNNTIAANFYAHLANQSTRAKIKKFQGFREAELFGDDIPLAVYDNLLADIRKQLPLFQRSLKLRAKVLDLKTSHGETKIAPYDRIVSLVNGKKFQSSEAQKTYSWKEACELVLEACKPLGEEYCRVARKGLLEERWADYTENKGKRSGAFSGELTIQTL